VGSLSCFKVLIDYHVEVDKRCYRVPHALVGQALEARIARIARIAVELLHRDQRIAFHARSSSVGGFSTEAELHALGASGPHGMDPATPDRL
jgi:hypothetical protein